MNFNSLIDQLLQGIISNEQKQLIIMIIQEAASLHVDPILAVSMAILESALNPKAIGDNGTSFGLYQLHQGGELGNMTMDDAFDPQRNTHVALEFLKKYAKTGMNPGQIAAACQRPQYPEIYEYTVNLMYPMVGKLLNNLGVYDG